MYKNYFKAKFKINFDYIFKEKPQEIPATSNVTITHVKIEKNSVSCEEGEGSDKDEAEGDDSELDSEEEIDDEANAQNSETSPLKRQPIKQ